MTEQKFYAVPLARQENDQPFEVVDLPELPNAGDCVQAHDGTGWVVARRLFRHQDGCVTAIVDRGSRFQDRA